MSKPLFWESLLLAAALSGTTWAQAPADATEAAEAAESADAADFTDAGEDIDVEMPGVTVSAVRERNLHPPRTSPAPAKATLPAP
jgi:hypothetical protein